MEWTKIAEEITRPWKISLGKFSVSYNTKYFHCDAWISLENLCCIRIIIHLLYLIMFSFLKKYNIWPLSIILNVFYSHFHYKLSDSKRWIETISIFLTLLYLIISYYILVSHILRQITHLYYPSKNQRDSTFWGIVQQFKTTVNNTFHEWCAVP